MSLSVLIVEDDSLVRESLTRYLKEDPLIGSIQEATTVAEARRKSMKKAPDIALLDINLPDGDGIELAKYWNMKRPMIRILCISSHMEHYTLYRVRRAIILGFLDKRVESLKNIGHAIRQVLNSKTYYSQSYKEESRQMAQCQDTFYKVLTMREIELMPYFGLGMSNEEISRFVKLTRSTIKGHRRNILAKLGLAQSRDLIAWSLKNGFVRGNEVAEMLGGNYPRRLCDAV